MRLLLRLALLLCLAFFARPLASQNYVMNGSPITDCSGTFYDPGGPNGNYGNNQSLLTTICSDGSGGTHIRLTFSGADLAAGDEICFYDGNNINAPLLACSSDYPPGQPFVVQATAANPSGCLTVEFNSDGSGTASGWSAVIECVASCQTVLADLVSTNPAAVPADTGWIDICPNERVFFNSVGAYPQNGLAYQQSDLTTTFEWNFGDGGIAYGPNTSHRFAEPGGYIVQVFLTDAQGCRSTNLINQRVRVAHRPSFNLANAIDQSICAGDTVQLTAAVDSSTSTNLVVLPVSSAFSVEGSRSDSLALPDGTGIPYETSIFFTEFSPGQVLTNANDLESICVNMEHSWMRDMEISLTCPNGQSVVLHNFGGQTGSQVFLGEPNDNDNFFPIPGLGYDYCWTPDATNGTWLQYANTVLGGSGTLPEGDYSTFDPLSDLVGCPMNGEWTITVTDLWPIDNGYIFNWSLKFKDELYPNIETFTPNFVSWSWNDHPSIFYSDPDSIAAAPQNAGTAGYVFTVEDDFGCTWDTLVSVQVLPPTHPDCHSCEEIFGNLQDTSLCTGLPVQLDASTLSPATQEVRFEAYPDYSFGNKNHPHINPYASPIAINSLGYNTLSDPTNQITSICMDIETDFDADLHIYLRAPDGTLLELSTGNGGAGDNYKITCFAPTASTPIVGSAAPFNGTYSPEGNWTALQNVPVNGDWSLMVSDGFGINQMGKLKWWSIGFNFNNSVSYIWTNPSSLSCTTCPNPVASPSSTTTYMVAATDAFNCVRTDTVTVNIATFFPAPTGLGVLSLGNGNLTWSWNAVPGATGYEVSTDGGSIWLPANGNLAHTVTGLNVGDNVGIQVRALNGSPLCPPAIANATSVYVSCDLNVSVFSTAPLDCAGDSTGTAILSISNSNGAVEYFVNGFATPFPGNDLPNIFPEGNHVVVIRDALGCRDTFDFDILGPAPLVLSATATDVGCNGEDSGALNAATTGGTGSISIEWQNCAGGPTFSGSSASNLFAGCYRATATDANGCASTDTATIAEPAAYQFAVTQDSVACNGGSSGTASVTVESGGTAPYSYLWDSGATTATASNLDADFHFVTVTDANNCAAVTFAQVLEPALLIIDSTASKAVSCFGQSNGTATAFPLGGVGPYTYFWSDAQDTPKALNLLAGNYDVTVTDANGCSAQASVEVETPAELVADFNNVVGETCAGDCQGQASIETAGGTGPYTFAWDNNSIPAGVQTATGLCPGDYQITVTDARGCTDTQRVDIAAAVALDVRFDETPPTCTGLQNGAVTTIVAGGAQPYTYLWDDGSNTPDVQNLACGMHILTLTDNVGCVRSDTVALICPETIQILNIENEGVRCFAQANGTATVQAQGGTGALEYAWSDPSGQASATATGLAAGTYTVTITDVNGCNTATSTTITQPPVLAASVNKEDANCFGSNDGSATVNAMGGTTPYTYAWSSGGTAQQAINLSADTYFVTVSDQNQCSAVASVELGQPNALVQVSAAQLRPACFGESNGQAAATASGGNGAPYTFAWSSSQNGPTAIGLALGTYTVTATDGQGCTGTQTVVIQQFDKIEVNVAFVPPTCFGANDGQAAVNLLTGGAGMGDTAQYIFQWNVPGMPSSSYLSGLPGGQYALTVTDYEGCSGTFSFPINEPPAVSFQVQTLGVTCFGLANGKAEVSNVQNATQPLSYVWSNNTNSQSTTNLLAGNYTVRVTDDKGCSTTQSFEIQQPTALSLGFQTQPLICAGDSNAVVTANVLGGTPTYNLNWGNGPTTAQIGGLGPGDYQLTVTDANGCTLSGTATVAQPDSIVLRTESADPQCFGAKNGRIRLVVLGGQTPYRYSLDGGAFGGSSTFLGLGAGAYRLQVRDANGCVTTIVDSLAEPLPIEVALGPDTTLTLGDSLLLTPDVSNAFGMPVFAWKSFLVEAWACADSALCEGIWAKPILTNTYRVVATDANGCTGEDEITVRVEKPRGVYVPTAFSPNGDLTNDLLNVFGKSAQVRNVLIFKVFDRWGELLYEDRDVPVNDVVRGWDGRFQGKECDPGVYVWLLEVEYADGFRELLRGNTTLLR
jgi:gliding motility-associated-like protein